MTTLDMFLIVVELIVVFASGYAFGHESGRKAAEADRIKRLG